METGFIQQIYENERNHWWYVVRRKIVHRLLDTHLEHAAHISILDVGCGAGLLTKELERYGKVAGIDISPDAVRFSQSRGIRADTQALETFRSEKKFDCVLALDVLEHCYDDARAIRNIRALLKPNGIAVIFVPAFSFLWGEQDDISHHFRRYRAPELRSKFERSGFRVLRQSYFNFFLAPAIFAIRKILNVLNIKTGGELKLNNRLVNYAMKMIFSAESALLSYVNFPFGVSILGVYQKSR